MADDWGDLTLQLRSNPPADSWLKVELSIGEWLTIDAVLNPGLPTSIISPWIANDPLLRPRGLVEPRGRGVYLLHDLRIQAQHVPDLRVRVSRLSPTIGLDCVIGFDFVAQYSSVHFFPRLLQAVLIR